MFEVNTHNYTLLRVWDLQCVTINSITCVTINSDTDDDTINSNDDSYCVTASADGIVRVWSSEFTMVVMETDLESPVMSVGVGGANTVTCVTQVRGEESGKGYNVTSSPYIVIIRDTAMFRWRV